MLASACVAACAALPAHAQASSLIKPVGWGPLSDHAAAKRVKPSKWEPRPQNSQANRRVPTRSQLSYFRSHENPSNNPYYRQVTGHFRGTTDEIIQWAAYKWGIKPNLLRAVAATESWWVMSFRGDSGDSYGLFQVRVPYHCCAPLIGDSTAFNADYYGSEIRGYYDGRMTWLNTVSGNGRRYRKGDLWGSVGAWYSGRWHAHGTGVYIKKVTNDLHQQVWRGQYF